MARCSCGAQLVALFMCLLSLLATSQDIGLSEGEASSIYFTESEGSGSEGGIIFTLSAEDSADVTVSPIRTPPPVTEEVDYSTGPADDEDSEGSGEESGSGTIPPEASTTGITITDIKLTVGFFRISFILKEFIYNSSLRQEQRNSEYFQFLEKEVRENFEELYSQVLGVQFVTILQFTPIEDGTEVYLDLGTVKYYSEINLRQVFEAAVEAGYIMELEVNSTYWTWERIKDYITCSNNPCSVYEVCVDLSDGYRCDPSIITSTPTQSFTPSITPPPPPPSATSPPIITEYPGICGHREKQCNNTWQCVDVDFICDGDEDCDDGSDEYNCHQLSCEPNEFRCRSGNCAQKIWLCDGDDDCGDNSDEEQCPSAEQGSLCASSQFMCDSADQCVARAFQCDRDPDCNDGSDEDGCAAPVVIIPPMTPITVTRGDTVQINCTAVGIPVPLISWRLNWGPIPDPPRVTTTSQNGVGILTIRNAMESDQGAYTCEALNSMSYIFANPDAILIVIPREGVCQEPYFNENAFLPQECLQCYCSYRTRSCTSSNYYKSELQVLFDESDNLKGVGLVSREESTGQTQEVDVTVITVELDLTELIIFDFNQRLISGNYYWTLPESFRGNQLGSYGGTLEYTVRYNPFPFSQQTTLVDVLLKSGDTTLVYEFPTIPPAGENTQREVLLVEERWYRMERTGNRGDTGGSERRFATNRAEFMRVLSNIDEFLIKASYYTRQRDASLSRIIMSTAIPTETVNGRAYLVERCFCPRGYAGLSCERCEEGYMESGLDDCIPCECNGFSDTCDSITGVCTNCQGHTTGDFCDICEDGYYGEPANNGLCMPCPCPLDSPPNQFSPTCFMDSDGYVTCNNCALGYEGRNCGVCSPGYVGDPTIPGELCLIDDLRCNIAGTMSDTGSECICKRNTRGEFCEECQRGMFYLSPDNPLGCISCFCMGVSRICSSTNEYRAQVKSQFTSDTQDFTLTDRMQRSVIEDGFRVNSNTGELSYDLFGASRRSYYWSVPIKFLGDKVSSYGGNLRYTLNIMDYDEAVSLNRDPDIEIRGNEVTLLYRHKQRPNENAITYTVPFYEQYWTRMDGQPATREFLMMTLADLDYILIRATYSTDPQLSVIQDVMLDVAEPRNTGLGRVYAVEQCVCPLGYTGLSCEDCDAGYTRAGGGLYLGLCEACDCSGHSGQCDPESGECFNCRDNTAGYYCDECADGSVGDPYNPSGCVSINARPTITIINDLEAIVGEPFIIDVDVQGKYESVKWFKLERTEINIGGEIRSSIVEDAYQLERMDLREGITVDVNNNLRINEVFPYDAGVYFIIVYSDLANVTAEVLLNVYTRPVITIINEYTAVVGEPLIIPVDVQGDYESVEWFKLERVVIDMGEMQSSIVEEGKLERIDLRPEIIVDVNNNLRINEVSMYDTGSYLFVVYWKFRDVTAEVTLNVVLANTCDPAGTLGPVNGFCECKQYVYGDFCELCMPGYYNLFENNPDGCTPCFCSGVSRNCSSSDLYHSQIRLVFDSTSDPKSTSLRNVQSDIRLTSGFFISPNNNEIAFNDFGSYSPSEVFFWELPPRFKGDRVSSYGGTLGFTIYYTLEDGGQQSRDTALVELFGNDITLLHRDTLIRPRETTRVEITLTEDNFERRDGAPATREHFLMTLSDLEHILIRATFSRDMRDIRLSDITLDTGVPQNTGGPRAMAVEDCRCPPGYKGSSCEDCAPGYTRSGGGLYLGLCMPCDCNGHSNNCDPETGVCYACQHNSYGDYCESCLPGYYGDSTSGTNTDCRQCECPLSIPSNQFSDSCTFNPRIGYASCDFCPRGYEGDRCERCAPGYVGNPLVPGDRCVEDNRNTIRPTVTITNELTAVLGQSIVINVEIEGEYDSIEWVRRDGRSLRSGITVQVDNSLRISEVRTSDSGVYLCIVYWEFGSFTAEARLNVVSSSIQVIIEEPRNLRVNVGETITFYCRGISESTFVVVWMKDGRALPRRATDFMGILTIVDAMLEDSGTYRCTASNQYDYVSEVATVVVESQEVEPFDVRISPRFLTVVEGERAEFTCTASGVPEPVIRWSGGENGALNSEAIIQNGVLIIPEARRTDEGEYFCEVKNSAGMSSVRTILYVTASKTPQITVNPGVLSVNANERASFYCAATGDPPPERTWTRLDGPMSADAVIQGGYLIFYNPTAADSGTYQCTAVNNLGSDSYVATLTVISTGVAPYIDVVSRDVQVSQGSTLILTCNVTGTPPPTITWSRSSGRPFGRNMQIRGIVLRIADIQLEDRDVYSCTAVNPFGQVSANFYVEVERREMVQIEVNPLPTRALISGSNIQFLCTATAGQPQPRVTWSRAGGEPFSSNTVVENGALRIMGITSADQGVYICTGVNEVGSAQISLTLIVEGIPQVTITPSDGTDYLVGDPIVLECISTGDPMPNVMWMKREGDADFMMKSLDIDESGTAVYYISNAQVSDSGYYKCRANNRAGMIEKSVSINVIEKEVEALPPTIVVDASEKTVVQGNSVSFTCSAPGTAPGYSVRWTRLGSRMPGSVSVSNGVLTFDSAKAEHSGQYYCVVANEFGMVQELVTLYVLVPPMISVMPIAQTRSAGSIIRISCMADGTRPMTYEWQKVGSQLPATASDVAGMLTITIATAADAGEYLCVATNQAGRSEMSATVSIQVPPKVIVSPSRETRAIGQSVEFQCSSSGTPPPVIIWSKENSPLPVQHSIARGVLTINNLLPGNEGIYVCSASNPAGSSKATTELILQAAPDVEIMVFTEIQYIPVGESITLECHASGDPLPTVIWTRVDKELPITAVIDGGTLALQNVQLTDTGVYTCTATNNVGTKSTQVLLYVQAKPQITVSPETRSASEGTTVVFTCFASGFPVPDITWYKQDGDLPNDYVIQLGVLTLRDIKKEDQGTYVCSASNPEGTVEYKATLIVGELIPMFMQMPQSYISYPRLDSAYFDFDISISFKPESPEGLVLFNSQNSNRDGDFFSFGLSDGYVELRFDLGAGTAVIRSQKRVELGQWHSVRVRRHYTDGFVQVDDQEEVNGTAPGLLKGLDLVQAMYLGGVPEFETLPPSAGFSTGFVGCISQLVVNGFKVFLTSGAMSIVNVDECVTCEPNTCLNAGICEPASAQFGYQCQCQEGFSGNNCEIAGNRCTPGVCGEGVCIGNIQSGGYRCICPVGTTGDSCEIDLTDDDYESSGELPDLQNDYGSPIFDPAFIGDSYIAYEGLLESYHQVQLALMFRPTTHDDGLILFNGQRLRGAGDYIAIYIRDGQIIFQFDSGSGPAVLASNMTVVRDKWYTILAERDLRDGTLIINNGEAIKASSPGTSRGLNLLLPLYIGGVEDFMNVPRALGIQKGFVGCITEVEVDGKPIDLVSDAIGNTNVQECGEQLLCERQPCENGGTCTPISNLEYRCTCPDGYTGRHCETPVGPCLWADPCENGGSCQPIDVGHYMCLCPLGFYGVNCETPVSLIEGAQFDGTGYLTLPKNTIPRGRGSSFAKEMISITFSTLDDAGLVMWQGAAEGEDGSGQDFFSLGLKDGRLEFSYNLGSGPANLRSVKEVNDGHTHTVTISRTGRQGMLMVDDGAEVIGESQGVLQMLNVVGYVYLGGTPDIETLTGGQFTEGATICLSDFTFQMADSEPAIINFDQTAIDGVNVGPCRP